MEARVVTLEKAIPDIRERLVRVETKLDNVEQTMATKTDLEVLRNSISADMHKAMADMQKSMADMHKAIADVQKSMTNMTWRFIQVSLVLAGLAFTAAKFIH